MKKITTLLLLYASAFAVIGQAQENQRIGWQIYTDSISGFSIQLPEKPTVKRQEMAVPELDGATMPQKLGFATDAEEGVNYLFISNDMPLGYYMQDVARAFSGAMERIKGQATNISETKTIYVDSVEGRYFTAILNAGTFVRSWYFIRGNRAFYFMQQNQSEEPINDDFFINSLQFLPIKTAALVPDTVGNYAFKRFGRYSVVDGETIAYIKKATSVRLQNPYSGGCYLAEFNELSEYFNVLNLDTFYTNFTNALVGWSDSVISVETITVDEQPGRELWVYSLLNKTTSRYKLWIDNKIFVTIYAFCADQENRSSTQEAFFNSFKRLPTVPEFDIYASKAEKLLTNLGSQDTTIQKSAYSALSYYEFDSTETALLHAALRKQWPDDSTTSGIRGQLIDHVERLERVESIPVLAAIYQDTSVPADLRNHALLAIQSIGDSGIATYCNLFIATPPKNVTYYYAYFSPFFDSLTFAATRFEEMLPLMDDKTLGAGLISLAERFMSEDSALYYPMVYKALPVLTADAIAEANMELDSASSDSYYYSAKLNALIGLFNYFGGYPSIDPFTTILMDEEIDEYTVSEAIELRLKSKLSVPKSALERCFGDTYSRFSILTSCYQTGNENLIPKKYKSAESIAQTMFMEFLGSDDEYPDNVKIIGTLDVDGQTYYALQAEYEWDDSFSYFGVCGPINKKYPLAATIEAKCDSAWEETQSDWKEQAELLIATLREQGWPWEE